MRFLMFSALALAAIALPSQAAANEIEARNTAIELCRAEITAQSGLGADAVRFDNVRVRLSNVRVNFDVWRDGNLTNVRCDVARSRGELVIASITPAAETLAAAR